MTKLVRRIAAIAVFGLAHSIGVASGQYGPGECRHLTFVCKYKDASRTLPDMSCSKQPTSLTVANGAIDPTGNASDSQFNDGTQCGLDGKGKPCGDYLTRSGTCGDSSPGGPPDIPILFPGDPPDPCDNSDGTDIPCLAAASMAPSADPARAKRAVTDRLREIARQPLPAAVTAAIDELAALKTVHLRSRVLISERVAGASIPATALTEYEYWEDGGRYRIKTYLDPKLGFHDITDLAFDGAHYQLVERMGRDLMLALRSRDVRMVPLAIENPLFLGLAFLSPRDEERCFFCELRLADFSVLQDAARKQHVVGTGIGARGRSTAVSFAVTGGRTDGQETRYQVDLDPSSRVRRIAHRSEAGALLSEVRLSDYGAVEGMRIELPRRLQVSRYDATASEPWIVLKYIVDQIDANKPIDAAVFTIPFDAVDGVTDVDHDRRLKQPATVSRKGFCPSPP